MAEGEEGRVLMRKVYEAEGWETNRWRKLRVTGKTWFYCRCDRESVSPGAVCSLCGRVEKRKLVKY